jgi:hypothetical protein
MRRGALERKAALMTAGYCGRFAAEKQKVRGLIERKCTEYQYKSGTL